MKTIFYKPIFWILFVAAALTAGFLGYTYFSSAFSILSIDLKINRQQAQEKAAELARTLHIGPETYSQAASFESDKEVQTFVELEAGGKQALNQMIEQDYYCLYEWHVRHFNQFQKEEVTFYFKPDGTAYGFEQTLSENEPGTNVESATARTIATATAAQWHVNLDNYIPVEDSKEVQPGGRVDHMFVYERTNATIGAGTYRVRIRVSGDKVTLVEHLVKVPEQFTLKYREMRSANNSIASAANLAMLLLYLLGGCVVGLFLLMRRGRVIWRMPLLLGFGVALLHALLIINQLPIAWIYYDTALATHVFMLRQLMGMLYQFIILGIFYSLAFMAGESLTRAAFGDQIQLWRSWNSNIAGTTEIAGRTIGGYLLALFDLAYVVFFYLAATKFFNWWIPSDALVDPNILSHYAPWLSSVVTALGAGFMEECLFRAVPIAGFSLLGKRFGNYKLAMVVGFIVQALIFSAAHANYPSMPSYSRVVELVFFSLLMGGVYLRFGLLPAIISHYTYDVILMSLPLFVSHAPGALINRGMVILLSSIPLLCVLFGRLKNGAWKSVPAWAYNSAWQPIVAEQQPQAAVIERKHIHITHQAKIIVLGAALVGSIAWMLFTPFKQDGLGILLTRTQAIEAGQNFLNAHDVSLSKPWQPTSTIYAHYTQDEDRQLQHMFIWQQEGPEQYQKLIGTYLKPATWNVNFVRFAGTINERAQSYTVTLNKPGTIIRYVHKVPEATPGAQLTEEQARVIALKEVADKFNLTKEQMTEISAVATKHPERKDWTFTFADNTHPLALGQTRIEIDITGDKMSDASQQVHVPEQWKRETTNKLNMIKTINMLCILLLGFLLCWAIAFLLGLVSRTTVLNKTTLVWGCILGIAALINIANSWPTIIAYFNTSEPFINQVFMFFGVSSIMILIKAGAVALILSALVNYRQRYISLDFHKTLIYGASIGLLCAGVYSTVTAWAPKLLPVWADFGTTAYLLPSIAAVYSALAYFTFLTMVFQLWIILLNHITRYGQSNLLGTILITLVLTTSLLFGTFNQSFGFWLVSSTIVTTTLVALYYLLLKYDLALIPIATGIFVVGQLVQQAFFNAYVHALAINLGASVVILVAAYVWCKLIHSKNSF